MNVRQLIQESIDRLRLIEEAKDSLIKRIPGLTADQKEQLIEKYKKNPYLENLKDEDGDPVIDWNRLNKLTWEDFEPIINHVSKTKEKQEVKVKGADVLYEDKNVLVIKPLTKDASICYGKGTKWCTAAMSHNMFKGYFNKKRITLIYVIDKNPNPQKEEYAKMAIAIDNSGNNEIFDSKDNHINEADFFRMTDIFGIPRDVFKWYDDDRLSGLSMIEQLINKSHGTLTLLKQELKNGLVIDNESFDDIVNRSVISVYDKEELFALPEFINAVSLDAYNHTAGSLLDDGFSYKNTLFLNLVKKFKKLPEVDTVTVAGELVKLYDAVSFTPQGYTNPFIESLYDTLEVLIKNDAKNFFSYEDHAYNLVANLTYADTKESLKILELLVDNAPGLSPITMGQRIFIASLGSDSGNYADYLKAISPTLPITAILKSIRAVRAGQYNYVIASLFRNDSWEKQLKVLLEMEDDFSNEIYHFFMNYLISSHRNRDMKSKATDVNLKFVVDNATKIDINEYLIHIDYTDEQLEMIADRSFELGEEAAAGNLHAILWKFLEHKDYDRAKKMLKKGYTGIFENDFYVINKSGDEELIELAKQASAKREIEVKEFLSGLFD